MCLYRQSDACWWYSPFLSTCCYPQSVFLQSLVSVLSCHCLWCHSSVSPPHVCPLSPPQTVEHGFPHQPSALSYSPSLQLLAIGTRSGAIKLYPSLYLCVNSCQGGIWASCLNLRQAVLMNGCDAPKSSSAVHMGTWFRYFHFPTLLLNAAWHSQTVESVSP